MTVSSGNNQQESPPHLDFAAGLLNQQLWCWGRDIESEHGNLLLEFGFRRTEPTNQKDAASLYRLEPSPECRLVLRGFGVFYGDDQLGGLFIRRFDFQPAMTPSSDFAEPPWLVHNLPKLRLPELELLTPCLKLTLALIDWIRKYEVWIAESYGVEYRRKTLVEWQPSDLPSVEGEKMPGAWRTLGVELADHPEQWIRCV